MAKCPTMPRYRPFSALPALLVSIVSIPAVFAAEHSALPPPAKIAVNFEEHVRPIFEAKCLECHGPKKQKSDFRIDVKKIVFAGGVGGEPTVIPGKSADSLLVQYVSGAVEDMQMPPQGDPLTADQIGILRAWIDQGAVWPETASANVEDGRDWWSLQPLSRPTVPTVAKKFPNAIDAFLEAKRTEHRLTASPEADRRMLIRRLSLTLTGLPPSPEETEAFVRDPGPQAYEKLVDRLLASPRFGERWAQHWLDIVRWAETNGSESNLYRKNAWPYRDYVIRAFNEDKPFDRFIHEQIAGDATGEDAATGFLVSGMFVHPATVGREEAAIREARADRLDETIQTVSASLLGLTMACARCHNHKFDPIPHKDYYALAAVFQGLEYGTRPWRDMPDAPERAQRASALWAEITAGRDELRAQVPSWTEEWPSHLQTHFAPQTTKVVRVTFPSGPLSQLDELEIYGAATGEKNLALARHGAKARSFKTQEVPTREIANVLDGRVGATFAWQTRTTTEKLEKTPWLEVELPAEATIDHIALSSDRETFNETDYLVGGSGPTGPRAYRLEVRLSDGTWREVANVYLGGNENKGVNAKMAGAKTPAGGVAAEQLEKINRLARDYTSARPQPIWTGFFVEPVVTHLFGRGDPMDLREEVVPNALSVLGADLRLASDTPDVARRRGYAEWLTDPKRNPLTPRVLANRLWVHVFGHGIVATPGDFGKAGAPPTHPELLDWLASEFVESGWSAKTIIRELVTSAAFRQSSAPNEAATEFDSESRYLWRYPPRRVEAEVLRDATLAVAGTLDLTMGGPGFRIHADKKRYEGWQVVDNFGPATWRRMIYQERMRGIDDRMFTAFDRPECGQVTPRRTISTTPLQALNLFNGEFILGQAGKLAERAKREVGADLGAQINRVFALVYCRTPSAKESQAAQALVAQDGLSELCRVLLNTNEYAFIE